MILVLDVILDVTLTDSSGNVFSLFKTKTIATNTTTELLTHPLVVEESEDIKGTS